MMAEPHFFKSFFLLELVQIRMVILDFYIVYTLVELSEEKKKVDIYLQIEFPILSWFFALI